MLDVGGEKMEAKVTVVDSVVGDVVIVLGMDLIKRLGGVTISEGTIRFGQVQCAIVTGPEETRKRKIVDKDFEAEFDGTRWTVRWNWKDGKEPCLTGTVAEYDHKLDPEDRKKYEK